MKHPVLSNIKNIAIYIGCWIPVTLIHLLILNKTNNNTEYCNLIEAISYNTVYALLGLSVYFITLYNRLGDLTKLRWTFAHLVSYALLAAIWLFASRAIHTTICKTDNSFLNLKYIEIYLTIGFVFYIINVLFNYLYIVVLEQEKHRESEEKLRRLAKESELQALKSQINPHFLFNSLNSANYLTISEPLKASEMLVKLAEYLRFSLKKGAYEMVTLTEEIENCKRYLELETYRFGEKLQQTWDFDKSVCETKVPVMILQPLYENAVKHGVYESTVPVSINTTIKKTNNFIAIEITNAFDPEAVPRKGAGVGIQNVADRLRLVYGSTGLLNTRKSESDFKSIVTIPLN